MTANCPECDATIALAADVVEGEIIVCPDCAVSWRSPASTRSRWLLRRRWAKIGANSIQKSGDRIQKNDVGLSYSVLLTPDS